MTETRQPPAPARPPRSRPRTLLITAVLLALGATATAARAADDKLVAAQLQKLFERMQQLEQSNQELQRQVSSLAGAKSPPAGATAPPASVAPPAAAWDAASDQRLQQVERQQQTLQQQVQSLARPVEPALEAASDEITVETGVVAVMQNVNANGSEDGQRQSRLNYRGDVLITVPTGSLGEARGKAVGQLRFGQGGGVALRPTHTGAVNSTTFEAAAGSDETYAVVAQAYYQLEWPLDGGRFNEQASSRIELTVGKMDVFGFFDQNAVAGDEGAQFLNNVFVHNPLLDSGGDIGADAYGFAPGMRVGIFNEGDGYGWGASIGVLSSGSGATFAAGPGGPLVIAQLELSPRQINGEARGSYRVYAWTNGRTTDFDGLQQRHSGIGISADQRVGRDWNLFGRLGQRTVGDGNFDSAVTLGFEHGGRAWGRGHDAVGLAAGWLKTGDRWREATASGSLAGFAASGSETIAELYYRIKLNANVELTPDFQLIHRAGGDGTATTARLFGLRASLGF